MPPVLGVPLITPADEMTMPVGRPVADQVSPAVVATLEVSVATEVMLVMAVPDTLDLAVLAGVVTATVLVIVQVKETELEYVVGEPLSVAVMVTEQAHAVVGVPLITPVAEAMVTPTGRPVADQVSPAVVATDEVSVAVAVMLVMAVPDTLDLAVVVGVVTATVLVMVQAMVAVPVWAWLSVAVTVTEQAHAVVGVPLITPVAELMVTPAGRPVADHDEMVAPEPVVVAVAVTVGESAVPLPEDLVDGTVTTTVLVTVQVKETEPK